MEYAFCSPEITELSKALIAVQKDLKPALKDTVNPFVHNSYASLGSIMDACRNALIEHDVLLTQYPVPVEGEYLGLVTKLVHAKSGQYQRICDKNAEKGIDVSRVLGIERCRF